MTIQFFRYQAFAAILLSLPTGCSEDDPAEAGCLGTCSALGCGECPPMEQVTMTDYAIDRQRVTREEYRVFESTDIAFQASEYCTHESSRWRSPLDMDSTASDGSVVFVTWCQAQAYCEWAEKRLCGRRGGGSLTSADVASSMRQDVDEWYAACTSGSSEFEDLPLNQSSEWLDGTAERNGAEGPIVAGFPGCSEWTSLGWNTSNAGLGFRCCSDL